MADEAKPAETKTDAAAAVTETAGLPASPLATADVAKHEGAEAAKTEAPAEPKADPAAETTTETKTEAPKAETKPEGASDTKTEPAKAEESAAESGEKKPPEASDPKTEGDKKPEAKPEEKKAESTESTETTADQKPQAPPVYEAYKVPETFKLEKDQLDKFNGILGKAELAGKADHAAMQALGQELVDFYQTEVSRIGQQVAKYQVDVWNRTVEQRVNDLKKDSELGGNRIETSLGNAKYALESLVPGFSKEDAAEWIKVADAGGVSHHRLTIKLLNKIYEMFAEPEPVNEGLKPVNNQTKSPGQRGWYDSVDGQKAAS